MDEIPPSASPQQAVAIVVALERFIDDTVRERAPSPPVNSAWADAALLEAAGHEGDHPAIRLTLGSKPHGNSRQ